MFTIIKRCIGNWVRKRIFFVAGIAATLWFLIRVIPKPSRATYPCQRAAFPVASSFVAYVAGIIGTAWVFRLAHKKMKQSYPVLAAALIFLGLTTAWLTIHITQKPAQGEFVPSDPPNTPMGVAKGIFPGRVAWIHDPNATFWDPAWDTRDDIFYWDDQHTNQAVVEEMVSKGIRRLTGQTSDEKAWETLFENFNLTRGKGKVGYATGEKIVMKPNHNTQHSHDHRGNTQPETPPALYVALLKQLIEVVGIPQENITICEPSRFIDDKTYDKCSILFPDVRYVETNYFNLGSNPGTEGRLMSELTPDVILWSGVNITGLPIVNYPLAESFVEADYIINLARLQGHGRAGITFCAKNWYGCFCVSPEYDGGINPGNALHDLIYAREGNLYSPLVDLMGHEYLGGKTLLYVLDGLWGFSSNHTCYPTPYSYHPFNNDYPSSLFFSQDPVAIDSVALDFLRAQFFLLEGELDNYLHEAALAEDPPSDTFYDPEGDGTRLQSLGVHEHWNNAIDKQYSRSLNTGNGIELIYCDNQIMEGDINNNGKVDTADLFLLFSCWLKTKQDMPDFNPDVDLNKDGIINIFDYMMLSDNWQ
jgi:uncharacterized protein (DUF362 family)